MTGHATPATPLRRQLRLLRYMRSHVPGLTVVVLAMLVEVGLQLLRPWPLKLLVDNVIGHHRFSGLITLVVGQGDRKGLLAAVVLAEVGIFLLGTAAGMVYTFTSLREGQRMTYDLAADLFRHLQRMSLLFHTRRQVGDLIARVTGDTWCLNTIVMDALIPSLQAVVTLVAMFVIMLQLQSTLTALALGVLPFMIFVIRRLSRPIRDRSREQRDLEGKLMATVEQTLSAIPAVQAFTREDLEHRRFRRYADQTVGAYVRATVAGLWFELAAGLVTTLGTAAVMYVGGRLAIEGKLTPGTIIVFLSYLSSLYAPLDAMTHTVQTVLGASAEADRVMEVLEIEPEIRDRPGARPAVLDGVIEYDQVTFGYEPGTPVLADVSLTALPGQTLAIIGPTGAGKTTLVNLLLRFYDPWSGRITVGGTDLRDLQVRSLREQIALVLQDPFIFPLTVAENISYGRPDAPRAEIVAAARAANADEFIERLPGGYDSMVGERGATLSGGEKQRLSIARAFLKDAPVLILDEPTSALDASTERTLLDSLDRLMVGRITFVIAHRLSTIRRADQIVVVERGRIVERGSHSELLDHGGLYATLQADQTGGRRPPVLSAEGPGEV
jgi:ATP-binding cassette subfamily B protein/subfamily B ATP-binding cassette protein MsbA